jgi:hypothetical protein
MEMFLTYGALLLVAAAVLAMLMASHPNDSTHDL